MSARSPRLILRLQFPLTPPMVGRVLPARVCPSLSLVLAVPSCAPVSAAAPPQRLQRCKSFGISLFSSFASALITAGRQPQVVLKQLCISPP